jgi:hypothetical protein
MLVKAHPPQIVRYATILACRGIIKKITNTMCYEYFKNGTGFAFIEMSLTVRPTRGEDHGITSMCYLR